MYREYFKPVFRKLSRSPLYTSINIAGLAIAITAALLIYSHIVKEVKTDRFHPNKENIYRVTTTGIFSNKWTTSTCGPIGPFSARELAAVKDFTRINCSHQYMIQPNDSTSFFSPGKMIVADANLFRIFNFPFINGEVPPSDNSLWCILSARTAQNLFGYQNPTGLTLQVKTDTRSETKAKEYRIAGVMADIPAWSSIQADIIFNYGAVEDPYWNNWGIQTFLLLHSNADIESVEKAIPQLYVQNYTPGSKQTDFRVLLQPLTDIYFHSDHIVNYSTNHTPKGSLKLTIILCAITFIILLLATCNYMMIKLARISKEFSTMAIQKCYGANNHNLRSTLILEVSIQIIIALIIACMATYVLHPWFIGIMSPHQLYPLSMTIKDILIFIAFILILTAGISAYLCHYATRHLNQNNLKANIVKPIGRFDLKKTLATVQMTIFCTLLFCSAIVIKQMSYIQNKDLGLDTHNILSTFAGVPTNYEVFKEELRQNPDIISTGIGSSIPANNPYTIDCLFPEHPDIKLRSNILMGDADYLTTYKIELAEGENIHKEVYLHQQQLSNNHYQRAKEARQKGIPFTEEEPSYEVEALVNQKFVKKAGLTNPVGTIINASGRTFRIIGVTKDFHYESLHNSTAPVLICYNGGFNDNSVNIRYREGKLAQALEHIDNVSKTFPYRGEEIEYHQYQYSDFYDKDITFIKMINIFTGLAIFIGGMGIFAFSVFLAENKKKEVALRKVNGASEWEVISLLNRAFIRRVIIACLIGMPVAYFFMQKWMENYAYKTTISWWLYLITITICIVFVITVISWQTWSAASRNPVESLKSKE